MATKYERYITGDDTGHIISATGWLAQTFTPGTAHTITSVKLKVYRVGDPGTLTVSIRATTSDLPSGADLCVGTTNVNNLTEDTGGEWREISFTTSYALAVDTKYAIVARVLTQTPGNYVVWRADGTAPAYLEGAYCESADSGGSWTRLTATDFMFEDWGGYPTGGILSVKTEACTDIAPESLTGNGVVTDLGSSTVTQHGHCWSTSQNPTTASATKTTLGTAYQTGHFTSVITSLLPGVTYYFKAYATNTEGTAYGSQVSNTMATAIGRRHWWVEGRDFHWFGQDGVEYIAPGIGVASPDIPWPF